MANYASYSTPTLLVQTMATELIWSCSSTTKRFMQHNFDIQYNYVAYDLPINRTIEICDLQNVVIFSEHVHFYQSLWSSLLSYFILYKILYIYGTIVFVCMPTWMFTFTPPGFEPTDMFMKSTGLMPFKATLASHFLIPYH